MSVTRRTRPASGSAACQSGSSCAGEAQQEVHQEPALDPRRLAAADLREQVGLVGRDWRACSSSPCRRAGRADRAVGRWRSGRRRRRRARAARAATRCPGGIGADGQQGRQVDAHRHGVAGRLVGHDLGHVGQRRRHDELRSAEVARLGAERGDRALVAGPTAVGDGGGSSSATYACASAVLTPTHTRARGCSASSVSAIAEHVAIGSPAVIGTTALRSAQAGGRCSAP